MHKQSLFSLLLFEIYREYCLKYGEILECMIMRDREGRSRGFAFVNFKGMFIVDMHLNKLNSIFTYTKDRAMVDDFMTKRPHIIDGRQIEPKRAMPRDETSRSDGQLTVKKIFIGAIKDEVTEDDLK